MCVVFALAIGSVAATPGLASAATVPYPLTPLDGWDTNGTVYAVEVVGNTVFVGGHFSSVRAPGGGSSQPRSNLAAFNIVTGAVLPFVADTNNPVRSLESDGTTLWVGGSFNSIGGITRRNIAAVDAVTGAVRTAFDVSMNGSVHGIARIGSRIYAAGYFTLAKGVPQQRVASLDAVTGAPDANFQAGANDGARSIAASSATGRLFVGGQFTAIGGRAWEYVAELDPVTGAGVGPGIDSYEAAPLLDIDVSPDGSRVFGAVAGFLNRAQAWNTFDGSRLWYHRAMGDTQAVSYYDGVLYFGFHEGFDGDETVRMLAADVMTGDLLDFRPTIDSFYGVWALAASRWGLAVGGEFFNVSEIPTRGIAMFPGDGRPADTSPPTAPGNLAAVSGGGSVSLTWNASSDDRAVSLYKILRDGATIGYTVDTEFSDSTVFDNTQYVYTVRAGDFAGNLSPASAPLQLRTRTSLVVSGDSWRHTDNAQTSPSWRELGFDHSSWGNGPSELGFGDGDEATVLQSGQITYYFRKEITIPPGETVLSASLGLVRDDGAVVYVNGTEVARSNMPGGTITSSTRASSTVSGSGESQWRGYSIDPAAFRSGTNVIAVEVHQYGAGSSDVSFDLRLEADLNEYEADTTPPTRPLRLSNVVRSETSIDLSWDAATDNVGVVGYLVFRNNVQIGSVTGLTYRDSGLLPGTEYRYKTFAVDAAGNISPRSRISRGTTFEDTIAPSKPKNVTLVASPTSIAVDWDAATDNVGVAFYVVKSFGALLGTTTNTEFVMNNLQPGVEYHVAVRAVDVAGNRGPKVHSWITTPAAQNSYSPVVAGQVWRYRDDGSDQGVAWRTTGFNASGWSAGAAELGYGDGDEATEVNDGPNSNRHITTYFRRLFTITDASAVTALKLELVRDDGAVVYINGVEVFRDNMPSGPIDFQTLAINGIAGHDESEWIDASLSPSMLVTGTNVIAVEVHQNHRLSSDISFSAQLTVNP